MTTTTMTTDRLPAMAAETSDEVYAGGPVEVRFPVETSVPPWAHARRDVVEVEAVGPGGVVTLELPIEDARAWSAETFAAVSRAYREATGDPHALTDAELAELPDPNRYHRSRSTLVQGTQAEPAQVRFHIALTIAGQALSTSMLTEAIIDTLLHRFNTIEVLIDDGTPITGTVEH